ncbi:hypothetical protein FM106_23360 [Brachybacterium faecium]|nr:hypothetical protein FM106_23360 [Brachybacterium faecium]
MPRASSDAEAPPAPSQPAGAGSATAPTALGAGRAPQGAPALTSRW